MLSVVAIGDSNVLQYWEYKKGEMVQTFKLLEPLLNEISRVVVSGQNEKASIFVS